MRGKIKYIALLLLIGIVFGCTEPYALQTRDFESALVVEATITNELKTQEVKLTRTYRLEEDGPQTELGATVYITDETGIDYSFAWNPETHTYRSVNEFQVEPGKTYQLHITTSDGKNYQSRAELLTTVNNMEDVVASVENVDGERSVQIFAKSFDPANSSKYYRYEYMETYKIIAPYWTHLTADRLPPDSANPNGGIVVFPRDPGIESKTCYNTYFSYDIIQTSTNNLSEDRVNFPVRTISASSPMIRQRYSILVRQYVQNLASYTFYKTLKELSGQGSILSQNQPGFFYGNIRSVENPAEKVIGFFDVSSVSSKRIYFNYGDLFPGEQLPPYFVDCTPQTFKFCFNPLNMECRGGALLSAIGTRSLLYFDDQDFDYFFLVPPACGDCNYIGSNIVPAFWQD